MSFTTALLIMVVAAGGALVARMCFEARNPVLETVKLTDGPGALRVVHISDIHIKTFPMPFIKAVDIIMRASPDIVIISGDYIESAADIGKFIRWMNVLISSKMAHTEVFLCFGNHDLRVFRRKPADFRVFQRQLARAGATILENRSSTYVKGDKIYGVTGYTDIGKCPFNRRQAYRDLPENIFYHVGFSHNPDLALEFKGKRPELFLCGHFHGGQIWTPFGLEYKCLRKEVLCKMGIRRGLHSFNGRLVYINRGLGCVLLPLRLGSRPEVTLFLLP